MTLLIDEIGFERRIFWCKNRATSKWQRSAELSLCGIWPAYDLIVENFPYPISGVVPPPGERRRGDFEDGLGWLSLWWGEFNTFKISKPATYIFTKEAKKSITNILLKNKTNMQRRSHTANEIKRGMLTFCFWHKRSLPQRAPAIECGWSHVHLKN